MKTKRLVLWHFLFFAFISSHGMVPEDYLKKPGPSLTASRNRFGSIKDLMRSTAITRSTSIKIASDRTSRASSSGFSSIRSNSNNSQKYISFPELCDNAKWCQISKEDKSGTLVRYYPFLKVQYTIDEEDTMHISTTVLPLLEKLIAQPAIKKIVLEKYLKELASEDYFDEAILAILKKSKLSGRIGRRISKATLKAFAEREWDTSDTVLKKEVLHYLEKSEIPPEDKIIGGINQTEPVKQGPWSKKFSNSSQKLL